MTDKTLFSPPLTEPLSALEAWKPPADTFRDQQGRDRSSWISAMAKQVFGAYRRDDFADPDGFLTQLGMVLERYPDQIICDVTSPISGIQRKCKFPPTIAEVAEFCDEELARAERIRRYSAMGTARREPRARQHPANVFVPPEAPQYEAMREHAQREPRMVRADPDRAGLWVPLGWLTENDSRARQGFRPFTKAELEQLYRRAEGVEVTE